VDCKDTACSILIPKSWRGPSQPFVETVGHPPLCNRHRLPSFAPLLAHDVQISTLSFFHQTPPPPRLGGGSTKSSCSLLGRCLSRFSAPNLPTSLELPDDLCFCFSLMGVTHFSPTAPTPAAHIHARGHHCRRQLPAPYHEEVVFRLKGGVTQHTPHTTSPNLSTLREQKEISRRMEFSTPVILLPAGETQRARALRCFC
jgi:hypothetical protein